MRINVFMVAIMLAGAVGVPRAVALADRSTRSTCESSIVGKGGSEALTLGGSATCNGQSSPGRPARMRYVDCGPRRSTARLTVVTGLCGVVREGCSVAPSLLRRVRRPETTEAVISINRSGARALVGIYCDVPIGDGLGVSPTVARDEAEKLLPHPKIGVAPPGGVTLVNIETVLWVDTRADRFLGTVRLLGHRVDLRAHVERVSWDFGDGSTGTSTTPGKAYTSADPCKTVDCPDYFGHTYVHTGEVSITAQLTWTGEFRVDGGAWQPITGTVSAPATATGVHVKEARGILVPNP
jgi:hypothetical protein